VLQLFRTNQLVVHLLVLVYLAILWLPGYLIQPSGGDQTGGFVFAWLKNLFDGESAWSWSLTVALILVWFQGLVINYLMNEYRIGAQATLFPGLLIAWFYSSSPEFYGLSPQLVANTFVVLAIHQIYKVYRQGESALPIFNAGFLIGLASLSSYAYLILAVWGWVAIGILRSRKLRETLQYSIGLVLPWGFLYLLQVMLTPVGSFAQLAGVNWGWPPLLIGPDGYRIIAQGIVLSVIILLVVSQYAQVTLGETMQVQKNIQILYWAMLFGLAALGFIHRISFSHMLLIAVPIGTLLGLWFVRIRPALAEMIHFLLFVAVLVYQYFPLVYL